MRTCWVHFVIVAGALTLIHQAFAAQPRVYEAYPNSVLAKIEARDRFIRQGASRLPADEFHAEFVIRTSKLWSPGDTLKVAFQGGTFQLRKDIANTASTWSKYGNISFDFGPTNRFREWSSSTGDGGATIRIAFNGEGYWSMVGTDSLLINSNECTLSLEAFDTNRPNNWRAIVLHEFGHSLGFEHEHQSPAGGCEDEYRWQDDVGYVPEWDSRGMYIANTNGERPGVYTMFSGFPNYWDTCKVDCNLRKLRSSRAYYADVDASPFDPESIMKYVFDEDWFIHGKNSFCYTPENLTLSQGDKAGILRHYPFKANAIKAVRLEQQNVLSNMLTIPHLPPDAAKKFKQRLESIR